MGSWVYYVIHHHPWFLFTVHSAQRLQYRFIRSSIRLWCRFLRTFRANKVATLCLTSCRGISTFCRCFPSVTSVMTSGFLYLNFLTFWVRFFSLGRCSVHRAGLFGGVPASTPTRDAVASQSCQLLSGKQNLPLPHTRVTASDDHWARRLKMKRAYMCLYACLCIYVWRLPNFMLKQNHQCHGSV